MVLNPSLLEIDADADDDDDDNHIGAAAKKAFFDKYTVGVLLCEGPLTAGKVVQGMNDPGTLDKIVQGIVDAERGFRVRAAAHGGGQTQTQPPTTPLPSPAHRPPQDRNSSPPGETHTVLYRTISYHTIPSYPDFSSVCLPLPPAAPSLTPTLPTSPLPHRKSESQKT